MIESWVGGTAQLLPEAILGAGHRYTFVTRRPEHYGTDGEHPVLKYAGRVLQLETNDLPTLIAHLQQAHSEDPFDGALTICDYYLDTVVCVAEALGIAHPFPCEVGAARRKNLVRRALDEAGLPNVRHALATDLSEARSAVARFGYPVVLKPTDLASSAFVRLVRSDTDLVDAFAQLSAVTRNFRDQPREAACLIEEYVSGPELSIETCTVDGVTTVLGVTDKSVTGTPYFIEDGHMFPAAISSELARQLEGWATEVLAAVRHDRGIAHIELKQTTDGPRLIEINPRLPGNYIVELIRHVTGIDLLRATIDLALGRKPLLLRRPGPRSAAVMFLVPPHAGKLRGIDGVNELAKQPGVLRWTIPNVSGSSIGTPIDNACYLGHVLAVDPDGLDARVRAEQALRSLKVIYEA
jgi:argininosuccinate lyase